MSRRFTVIHVEDVHGHIKGAPNLGGHFVGSTPSSAAAKAAKKICRMTQIHGRCTLLIHIMETTRDSQKKVYKYKIKRVKEPKKIERGGVLIKYKYRITVQSLQRNQNKSRSRSR